MFRISTAFAPLPPQDEGLALPSLSLSRAPAVVIAMARAMVKRPRVCAISHVLHAAAVLMFEAWRRAAARMALCRFHRRCADGR
jgi:hypothetical protein